MIQRSHIIPVKTEKRWPYWTPQLCYIKIITLGLKNGKQDWAQQSKTRNDSKFGFSNNWLKCKFFVEVWIGGEEIKDILPYSIYVMGNITD